MITIVFNARAKNYTVHLKLSTGDVVTHEFSNLAGALGYIKHSKDEVEYVRPDVEAMYAADRKEGRDSAA